MKEPIKLLLIEDNNDDLLLYKKASEGRDDVSFVGMTRSSTKGIELTSLRMPDGVVLDLELSKGEGSGIEYLKLLKNFNFKSNPIVVVTTNTGSEAVHDIVRGLGVDYIFYKKQPGGYSPGAVFDTLILLHNSRKADYSEKIIDDLDFVEDELVFPVREEEGGFSTTSKIDITLEDIVENELRMLGMSDLYKGFNYFVKAICLTINKNKKDSESVFSITAKNSGVTYSSIIRTLQTLINKTWAGNLPEHLATHYTAPIDIRIKVPTPSELVHYYAEKIRKLL
jgi:CheY-like chemotaxis protein